MTMSPQLPQSQKIQVCNDDDIVRVRKITRDYAVKLNFKLVDQTKLVTAASELARNIVLYAGKGEVSFTILNSGLKQGLQIIFEDKGPGIPDIELAMKDGYTTSGGLGLGLGGAKRLVDSFDIKSKVGEGTKVTIIKWR